MWGGSVSRQTVANYRPDENLDQGAPSTTTAPPTIVKSLTKVGRTGPQPNPAPYYALRTLRWTVSLLALTVPLCYLVYFLIGGGIVRSELVQGTLTFRYVEAIVASSLAMTNKLFAFRPVVEGWNFMLLGLMVGTLLLRQVVMLPFDRAEHWAKSKFAPSKKMASGGRDTAAVFSAEER